MNSVFSYLSRAENWSRTHIVRKNIRLAGIALEESSVQFQWARSVKGRQQKAKQNKKQETKKEIKDKNEWMERRTKSIGVGWVRRM